MSEPSYDPFTTLKASVFCSGVSPEVSKSSLQDVNVMAARQPSIHAMSLIFFMVIVLFDVLLCFCFLLRENDLFAEILHRWGKKKNIFFCTQ